MAVILTPKKTKASFVAKPKSRNEQMQIIQQSVNAYLIVNGGTGYRTGLPQESDAGWTIALMTPSQQPLGCLQVTLDADFRPHIVFKPLPLHVRLREALGFMPSRSQQ